MKTTIDASGRLVIPKPIRDAAGLAAGMELVVTLRDGVLEILPAPAEVRIERRGRLRVAEAADGSAELDRETVEETRRRLRDRSR